MRPRKNSTRGTYGGVQRNPGMIAPSTVSCSLTYQDYGNVSSGGAVYWNKVYSLNSAFDPLYSVGGGACTGYAEWMGLYRYCLVKSVQIRFGAHNYGQPEEAGKALIMYVIPFASWQVGDSGSVPSLNLVRESAFSRFSTIYSGNSAMNPHVMNIRFDIAQLESGPLQSRIQYSSSSTADPAAQLTAQVGVIAADGATTAQTGFYDINITYHCVMWQRRVFGTA